MIAPFRLTKDDVNYTPYPLSHIGPAYGYSLSLMTGGRAVIILAFPISGTKDPPWGDMVHVSGVGSARLLYSAAPSEKDRARRRGAVHPCAGA